MTTSLARAERLPLEGYTFRRVSSFGRVIVEVQGQPTQHKRRATGETYIDPHGPYSVDPSERTCTCAAFANRGVCPHIDAACQWLEHWERGESAPVSREAIQDLIALREIGGDRYHCQERRVVVFRNWERASAYWESQGLVELCELVALHSHDLKSLHEAGRYVGLLLVTKAACPINFGGRA